MPLLRGIQAFAIRMRGMRLVPIDAKTAASRGAVYWPHADNILASPNQVRRPFTLEDTRGALNLHALLVERLCVAEMPFFYNQNLQSLLLRDRYSILLKENVIVPLLRRGVADFEELHKIAVAGDPTMYEKQPHPTTAYAKFLTKTTSTAFHVNGREIRVELARRLEAAFTDSRTLRVFGLSAQAVPLARRMRKYRGEHSFLRRSATFAFADEMQGLGYAREGASVKWLSSVIYHQVFADCLNLDTTIPHPIGSGLRQLSLAHEANLTFTRKIAAVHESILSIEDVRALQPEDISLLRKGASARAYFQSAKELPPAPNEQVLRAHEQLLMSYLLDVVKVAEARRAGVVKKLRGLERRLSVFRWTARGGRVGIGIAAAARGLGVSVPWAVLGIGAVWTLVAPELEKQSAASIRNLTESAQLELASIRRSEVRTPLRDLDSRSGPRF